MLPLHVLVWEKSEGIVPVMAMLEMFNGAAPVFFTVTVCLLVVFSATFGKCQRCWRKRD